MQTNITFQITDGRESIEFTADNTFRIFDQCEINFKRNAQLTLQAVRLDGDTVTVSFPNSLTPMIDAISFIWADRLNYKQIIHTLDHPYDRRYEYSVLNTNNT